MVDLPNRERTLDKEKLAQYLKEEGVPAEVAGSIREALAFARQNI